MGSTFWGVWKYVGCTRENAAPIIPSNVGVIFFSREESLLLNESRQLNLERQSQGRNSRR